ncbi:hypothetical protein [Williamsia sp. CHRR-6]|uniref:hypothetical protein n=1 Tax=Williamsia sp. CHRR-6 TaxID=2835871 RepID=UPI001BDB020F|nr:hypothetical protein [Williamsia sp. CHRR-6]MBT0567478.1 hypothetical protein [Williamsia sp. CHRR-6]
MTRRRELLGLTAISVGTALAVTAPLLGGGYLLYRDAVSTPRSYITDTALGITDSPARAVPQDWVIALASAVVDGGVVVAGLTLAALVLAGVGAGCLARVVLPGSGWAGSYAAAILAIWNPFVAERLLQGQWSLLIGYAALCPIILAAMGFRRRPGVVTGGAVLGWAAVAAFTPTGGLLAVLTVLAVAVIPLLRAHRFTDSATAFALAAIVNLPWVVASAVSSAALTSDGGAVDAFAARAEPALGTLGTLAGLGGIWNADAVPGTRTTGWALVATGCLLAVVAVGAPGLWRRRHRLPVVVETATLAVTALLVIALAATGPGRIVLRALIEVAPGAGLLRDTSKFVALAVPAYALAAAAAVGVLGQFVPRGLGLIGVAALVVLPLPDLAGLGGTVHTVSYPRDFDAVARIVSADDGDMLVLPPGINRRFAFTDGVVSLDPTPRLVRASVLLDGGLRVNGRVIDAPGDRSRATLATRAATAPAPGRALAALGVGWVVWERSTSARPTGLPIAYRGTDLELYRVPDAADRGAGSAARVAAWAAHLAWLAMLVAGAGCGVLRARRVAPVPPSSR